MPGRVWVMLIVMAGAGGRASADDVLYQYEGDVFPYDESAGWLIFNECDGLCSDSLQEGHYVAEYPEAGDHFYYTYIMASEPDEVPPESLWVEWRFRSNHPIGENFYTCDAWFTVAYGDILELVNMYGDGVVSFSGDDSVLDLEIDEFHTHRFESMDGFSYLFSVDGLGFTTGTQSQSNEVHYLQMGGVGGCVGDQIPDMVNEWDLVRFGTIAYGEQIVATDPPGGFLNPQEYTELDRFAITFDSANYVYIDEIAVETIGGPAPTVVGTWRRENDGPETLEVVLDGPIPLGARTTFTFDDGAAVNVVEYIFRRGDYDGDGDVDFVDFAGFQQCFNQAPPTGPCPTFDFNHDNQINLIDYRAFQIAVTGPE